MSKNNRFSIDDSINLLNERYNENFAYVAPFGGGPSASSTSFTVNCDNYPGEEILVSMVEMGGEWLVYDNYLYFKYREGIIEKATNIVGSVTNSSFKILFEVPHMTLHNATDNSTTLDQLTDFRGTMLGIFIIVNNNPTPEEAERVQEELVKKMKEKGFSSSVDIYFVSDEITYEAVNNDNLVTYINGPKWYDKMCYFYLQEDYSIAELEWR